MVPSAEYRVGAILIVGYVERCLNSLQQYLRFCLHHLCWKIYDSVMSTPPAVASPEEFRFDNLRRSGTVDIGTVEMMEGRDAPVVFYCCHRRFKCDTTWSGDCLLRQNQMVGISRARLRLYMYIEDFSSETVVWRHDDWMKEACRIGARVCKDDRGVDCKGCSECKLSRERMTWLKLVDYCRYCLRRDCSTEPLKIDTNRVFVSNSARVNPLIATLSPHKDHAQEVYAGAWWFVSDDEWWTQELPSSFKVSSGVQNLGDGSKWFSAQEVKRGAAFAQLLQSPTQDGVAANHTALEPCQLYARNSQGIEVAEQWASKRIDALGIRIRADNQIVMSLPFAGEDMDARSVGYLARFLTRRAFEDLRCSVNKSGYGLVFDVLQHSSEKGDWTESGEEYEVYRERQAFVVQWKPTGRDVQWDGRSCERVLYTYGPTATGRRHPLQKNITSTGREQVRDGML